MTGLAPAFADPVADSQSCFRAILTALSVPGRIVDLPPCPAPESLSPAAAAILLTLTDATTGVSLPEEFTAAWTWLAFHTGARRAAPEQADFVLATTRPNLLALRAGSDEAPEDGATLLLELPELGTGCRYRLTGPGIEHSTILHAPLDPDFAAAWRDNTARTPRGIDLLLCAGRHLIGLPRSLAIEEI